MKSDFDICKEFENKTVEIEKQVIRTPYGGIFSINIVDKKFLKTIYDLDSKVLFQFPNQVPHNETNVILIHVTIAGRIEKVEQL